MLSVGCLALIGKWFRYVFPPAGGKYMAIFWPHSNHSWIITMPSASGMLVYMDHLSRLKAQLLYETVPSKSLHSSLMGCKLFSRCADICASSGHAISHFSFQRGDHVLLTTKYTLNYLRSLVSFCVFIKQENRDVEELCARNLLYVCLQRFMLLNMFQLSIYLPTSQKTARPL